MPSQRFDAAALAYDTEWEEFRRQCRPQGPLIAYKPPDEPAWFKHRSSLPPKPQRFDKLTRWNQTRSYIVASAFAIFLIVAGVAAVSACQCIGGKIPPGYPLDSRSIVR